MILSGQVPKALGLPIPAGLGAIEVLQAVAQSLGSVNTAAAALAVGTSAAMLLLPTVHPKMPSALIAVGGATAASRVFGLDVATVGQLPSGWEAFGQGGQPIIMPPVEALPSLLTTASLIFAMTSVETLLSCTALDKMRPTSYKHSPDQELIGQGLANCTAAAFAGMPVTAVIARSSLNAKLQANTRLPALVQSAFVFSSVTFLSDHISTIPLPALSGMLITTGIGMLTPPELRRCYAVQRTDLLPYIATAGGMLTQGLAEGIMIGLGAALVVGDSTRRMQFQRAAFVHASLWSSAAGNASNGALPPSLADARAALERIGISGGSHQFVDTRQRALSIGPATEMWKLSGPLNFMSMLAIDDLAAAIAQQPGEGEIVIDVAEVRSSQDLVETVV